MASKTATDDDTSTIPDDDSFPSSDDSYIAFIEGLQLQEIILASLIESTAEIIMQEEDDQNSTTTIDEASDSESESSLLLIICEICAETKEHDQMFIINGCNHLYCNQCINNHVDAKLDQNIHMALKCPAADCVIELEFDSCKEILSKDVLAKWDQALFEISILDSNKFYCPYKDCSAMMLNDCDDDDEIIRESECPNCWRLFCAACRVPWHSGVECDEFQATAEGERDREDFMLRELVKEKEWNRCPRCKYYVEKSSGCLHITCICGFEFCYACGATYSNTHNCNRS